MAIQQTRYTYPSVQSKLVRLKYRHGQKYHQEDFGYGGLSFDATDAKVYFWRYVGRRKGRFSIAGYDPANKQWDDIVLNEDNLEELMRLQGFELAGVALGDASSSDYQVVSGTTETIGYGSRIFTIGFNLAFKQGMRVRAAYASGSSNYVEGIIESYSAGNIAICIDTISGSGTYSEWNITGQNSVFVDDGDWGTSLYTDINTWCSIFNKPGLYADTWLINDDRGMFGPTTNYFRLEANLQTPIYGIPRHHYKCNIWPSAIPFASASYSDPDFDMMVGVTPYSKNMANPVAYQAFQTLMSTMYVELIEIWFYEHETEGPLDPPTQVTLASPIQFTEQVFNFFFGKVPPTLFGEPGEYRLKFRVRTNNGDPSMEDGQYHDFWKTVNVDRTVQEISDPISICYKDAVNVYGSLEQCSYFLDYNNKDQQLTHLAKGSATDFAEPRDVEQLYDTSQVKVLNLTTVTDIGSGTEIELSTAISDHFAPLVIADGLQLNPSEPIRGSGIETPKIRDYTIEGNTIKLQNPYSDFLQVVYGYYGESAPIGKVEVIFRDESKASISGGNYEMPLPNFSYNGNFNMLFIQDKFNRDTRLVVPSDKYSINDNTNVLSINQAWLESVIAATLGTYYFRIQLHTSIEATNQDPIVVRSQLIWVSQYDTILPGRPKNSRYPEMLFRSGKPQFRHFDYGLTYQGTSTDSITIETGTKTFTTQANKPFYQGARVSCYTINGDYMRGRILSYSGTTLRISVDEAFGATNTASFWFIYMTGIDSSAIDFYFTASYGEGLFVVYDAEV